MKVERENAGKEGENSWSKSLRSQLGLLEEHLLAERKEVVLPEALHRWEGRWGGSFQKTSRVVLILWWGFQRRCEKRLRVGRASAVKRARFVMAPGSPGLEKACQASEG